MTDWTSAGFGEFFAAAHADSARTPFAWQTRLVEQILQSGQWPEVINAPTGSGKTAVIDVHVFVTAAMAATGRLRVPRRLSMVVDRRAIVDAHEDYARRLRQTLRAAKGDVGVLGEVYRALAALQSGDVQERRPFGIAVLRGGAAPSRMWLDDPVECQIICATPDMWGSRLLFRPYGASPMSAPRSAGLLAYDSVVVVDEAHLAQQFTYSARTVREQLDHVPDPVSSVPLQVVAMTATPAESVNAIGVEPMDLDGGDPRLLRRLSAPKHMKLVARDDWPASAATRSRVAEAIAAEAIRLRELAGGMVACVVNTVQMASEVAKDLVEASGGQHKSLTTQGAVGETVLLTGGMRPYDVAALEGKYPGLLDLRGNDDVAFVVATQVIEVGLDLDFAAMVTELAPAQAIVQRVGRVNRVGARSEAWVSVLAPSPENVTRNAGPYQPEDLQRSLEWLTSISDAPGGLSTVNCLAHPAPATGLRRAALMPLEPWDAMLLANTSIPQFAEPDLSLWLDDDLGAELSVEVILRKGLTLDTASTLEVLRATPPLRHEAFTARMLDARTYLNEASVGLLAKCYIYRAGELLPVSDGSAVQALRPGDVLILPQEVESFLHGIFARLQTDVSSADVYEAVPTGRRDDRPIHVARRVRVGDGFCNLGIVRISQVLEGLAGSGATDADDLILECLRDLLANTSNDADDVRLLQAILGDGASNVALIKPTSPVEPYWVVVANTARLSADEEVRQTWSRGRVLLNTHSTAVAERAQSIARRLDCPSDMEVALERAGYYHDAGKEYWRFQLALGNDMSGEDAPLLAKSGMRSPLRIRSAWQSAGLAGWRHEQFSAVKAAQALDVEGLRTKDLAIRLVGTSHGRGRPSFEQVTSEFLPEGEVDSAEVSLELFDNGAWEELVELTHRRHGVWGCAYLEALQRAADAQISGEGR